MESGKTDADAGLYRGRSVARRFLSPDGLIVLVGRSAGDNDTLTFKLASRRDFWLHVAAGSGSHVVVRNPAGLKRLPRATQRLAAGLAAGYSKSGGGGQVAVRIASRAEVRKPRGAPAGRVTVRRSATVAVEPCRQEEELPEG